MLEALMDLTVKRQGQFIPWSKGHVMEWSDEEGHKLFQRADGTLRIVEAGAPGQESQVAQRLMELAPEKVRLANSSGKIRPGIWIEIFSPLFGLCTARIHEVTVDECIITNHSVLKGEGEPVTIPASWICGVYRDQEKGK
jgi:hypothetical protein